MSNTLYVGDCYAAMQQHMADESVDLIITDPPFNIGKKYRSPFSDRMHKDFYIQWCEQWLTECIRVLKPNGSLYLFNYPENNAYLMPWLDRRLCFKRWLTWHYPTNTGISKHNYTRTQTSILYYVKGEGWGDCVWNKEAVGGEYRNPNDKRIQKLIAAGKRPAPYDVFTINLVKNVSKEKVEHPCQLPRELVDTYIRASSDPGHVVFDPFAGSGTVLSVAAALGRQFIGCELSPFYAGLIQKNVELAHPPIIV